MSSKSSAFQKRTQGPSLSAVAPPPRVESDGSDSDIVPFFSRRRRAKEAEAREKAYEEGNSAPHASSRDGAEIASTANELEEDSIVESPERPRKRLRVQRNSAASPSPFGGSATTMPVALDVADAKLPRKRSATKEKVSPAPKEHRSGRKALSFASPAPREPRSGRKALSVVSTNGSSRKGKTDNGASKDAPVVEEADAETAEEELDMFESFEVDDADAEVDFGDEEHVPGPDGDDEELEEDPSLPVASSVARPIVYDAGGITLRFEPLLRKVVGGLISEAKSLPNGQRGGSKSSMTFGFWKLFCKVEEDFLVKLYLPAIPLEVQSLFLKKSWVLADFLSLPSNWRFDRRPGIYCNWATGDIKVPNHMNCDAYVGSTKAGLSKRIPAHLAYKAKHTPETLPGYVKKSLHYQQICRAGVKPNFRILAAFDAPIEFGYLAVLETVFMIMLRTYTYQGHYSFWTTKASLDLAEKVRDSLDLPAVDWKGMNGALPCRQGFSNLGARRCSPCNNPACGKMTSPGRGRALMESGHPLGAYICISCYVQRRNNGSLPGKEKVLQLARERANIVELLKVREALGPDAPCASCQKVPSQFNEGSATRFFRLHELAPGKLFCMSCWRHLDKHKRVRNAEEIETHLYTSEAKRMHAMGSSLVCNDCGAVEGAPYVRKKHVRHGPTMTILCALCVVHLHKHPGEPRTPAMQQETVLLAQYKDNRQQGILPFCHDCGSQETAGGKQYVRLKGTTDGICKPCYDLRHPHG